MTNQSHSAGAAGTVSGGGPGRRDEVARLRAERDRLRDALLVMVEHDVDYMRRNFLGDPEEQQRIKQARAALASVED